jgi:uncharacterized protein (TIGR00159 family)
MLSLVSIFSDLANMLDFRTVLDIVIVATLIYFALIFIKQTRLFFIFNTLFVLWLIVSLARAFGLTLTYALFQPFITFFLLIIIVVFQREIRRFFEWLSFAGARLRREKSITLSHEVVTELVRAIDEMAHDKIGALIVLAGDQPLDRLIFGGITLNGVVSAELLISIFDPNTPGHDGAVVISKNKITQFAVHLPLAENYKDLNKTGTRHRAAVGITEETDALALVVSEERGTVSVARGGTLKRVNKEQFEQIISRFIASQKEEKPYNMKVIFQELVLRNWIEKVSALIIAFMLWVTLSL